MKKMVNCSVKLCRNYSHSKRKKSTPVSYHLCSDIDTESLNNWNYTVATKILLMCLVYLTHCESAILVSCWWGNEVNIISEPENKYGNGIFISTTFKIDQNKIKSIKNRDTSTPPKTVDKTNATVKINTNLVNKESPINYETNHYCFDNSTERLMSQMKNITIRKDDNPMTRDIEVENAVISKNREMLQEAKSINYIQINDRPIIGVLSQEQSPYLNSKYPKENFKSYIAASYVKLVEASGARVVPILIGKDRAYYRELVQKINGVLFPGGATFFNQSDGFADAGQYIYEAALEINENGGFFPIFGICLGFELLIILASGRGEKENRIPCYSFSNCSLKFVEDFRNSKMFRNAPKKILDILSKEDVTVNAHQFCITNDNINNFNLTYDWHVTSYSVDDNSVDFVATMENKRYPFYGIQFHPEKPSFEWKLSKIYPHTEHAILANRYFMDFFIGEAKKNRHSFEDVAEENKYLIYNYKPCFTGLVGSAFHQCYFFEPRFCKCPLLQDQESQISPSRHD